jgi:hypothetical protein
MVVLNKKAFKLPFMDKEKFLLLMRLGLNYDRATSSFRVVNYNNIKKLTDTLAEILGASEVTFTQTCCICGKDFPCNECKYLELCDTKNLPFQCVCALCLHEGKTFKDSG